MRLVLDNSRHIGLGDLIVLNGMARYYAEGMEIVYLYTTPSYLDQAKQMFADASNIQFLIQDDPIPDAIILPLGDLQNDFRTKYRSWAEGFYAQASLHYFTSYSWFKLAEWGKPSYPKKQRVFHHDLDRNFIIRSEFIKPEDVMINKETGEGLEYWIPTLRSATEIHVIDSAFMNLVERIPTRGKLFYHRYARGESQSEFYTIPFYKDWTVYRL